MLSIIFSVNQKCRAVISLFYIGIVVGLSLMPADEVPQFPWFEGMDKIIHLFMYLGFTWLLCWSLHSENKRAAFYIMIVLAGSWGALMEVFQLIMKYGRTFEWMDIFADVIGAIIGAIIYRLMIGKFREGRSRKRSDL